MNVSNLQKRHPLLMGYLEDNGYSACQKNWFNRCIKLVANEGACTKIRPNLIYIIPKSRRDRQRLTDRCVLSLMLKISTYGCYTLTLGNTVLQECVFSCH